MRKFFIAAIYGLIALVLALSSSPIYAGLMDYFKDEQGKTHWQYVANWSSGILIILLSIAAVVLFFSRRQINKNNKLLTSMNDMLEERVKERTATLDESNHKLTESNSLLEGEIAKHLETTKQLHISETYIKNILDSMPVMLVGLNNDCRITQWNKAAKSITRIGSELAIGNDLWETYPQLPLPKERVLESINENKIVHVRSSQRGQLHFEITIYPLANDNISGVVILIDDVTQQVQSENKLIQKDKMSAMGELSSIMAFDINPSIKRISTELENITSSCPEQLSDLKEEDYNRITSSINNMVKHSQNANVIVQHLLDSSNNTQDAFQPHDIIEIIDHSLELSSAIFTSDEDINFSDVEIERHYEAGLPKIPCFEAEIQQVFVSLFRYCHFALGHVERDNHTPKITIHVLTSYDSLWVKVQHNGQGIDLDEQQVLFEPFFSDQALDGSKHYEASKRLSFPYFIVTQHHKGHMAVTSNVDIGTTFHIELGLK